MVIIQTSINDRPKGKEIAYYCVKDHLAASVHITEVESLYEWQNEFFNEREWEIKILTSEDKIDKVHTLIKKLHPYKVPEFLVYQVQTNASVSNWIKTVTSKSK